MAIFAVLLIFIGTLWQKGYINLSIFNYLLVVKLFGFGGKTFLNLSRFS